VDEAYRASARSLAILRVLFGAALLEAGSLVINGSLQP
jgi:hypothetical protein